MILWDKMRLIQNVMDDDHDPGHVHVKYLHEIVPFDGTFKHHFLDHHSYRDSIKMYNEVYNKSEVRKGPVPQRLIKSFISKEQHERYSFTTKCL